MSFIDLLTLSQLIGIRSVRLGSFCSIVALSTPPREAADLKGELLKGVIFCQDKDQDRDFGYYCGLIVCLGQG